MSASTASAPVPTDISPVWASTLRRALAQRAIASEDAGARASSSAASSSKWDPTASMLSDVARARLLLRRHLSTADIGLGDDDVPQPYESLATSSSSRSGRQDATAEEEEEVRRAIACIQLHDDPSWRSTPDSEGLVLPSLQACLRESISHRLEAFQAQVLSECARRGQLYVGEVMSRLVDGRQAVEGVVSRLAGFSTTLFVHRLFTQTLRRQLAEAPTTLSFISDEVKISFLAIATAGSPCISLQKHMSALGLNDELLIVSESAMKQQLRRRVFLELGLGIEWSPSESPVLPRPGSCRRPGELPLRPKLGSRDRIKEYITEDLLDAWQHWTTMQTDGKGWDMAKERRSQEAQLMYLMDVLLVEGRSAQLFDLVCHWPRSEPAIADLKVALEPTQMKVYVSGQVAQSLEQRLLHQGVRTRNILRFYVSLVYAARFIDPSGVILSRIAGPIRRYLRTRADTIPVIVASLLGDDDGFTQLRGELDAAGKKSEAAKQETRRRTGPSASKGSLADTSLTAAAGDDDDEEEEMQRRHGLLGAYAPPSKVIDFTDRDYEPRPVDAGPLYRQNRSSDVIAMLVSIFDDKASFVKALEVSTARALLRSEAYDIGREYRNNEVLKRRFGESSLVRCDVMLADVIDSKCIDDEVRRIWDTPLGMLNSQVRKKFVKRRRGADGNFVESEELSEAAAAAKPLEMYPTLGALKPLVTSRHYWPDLEGSEVPPTVSASGSSAAASTGGTFVMTAPSSSTTGSGSVLTPSGSAPASTAPGTGTAATLGSLGPPPGGLDMRLPGSLGRAMDDYNRAFTAFRESRRLRWLAGFGRVKVQVEMRDGRAWEEHVDPIRAAVLVAAGEKGASPEKPLSLAELAEEMQLPVPAASSGTGTGAAGAGAGGSGNSTSTGETSLLDAAFAYWCNRGVLVPVEGRPGWFVECEVAPDGSATPTTTPTPAAAGSDTLMANAESG